MTVQTGGKQVLIHGLALIFAGLIWGFAPPLTPYPRLALGAHLQFETERPLFMVLGILLLKLPHRVRDKAVAVSGGLGMVGAARGPIRGSQCMVGRKPDAAHRGQAGRRGWRGALAGTRRETVSHSSRAGFDSLVGTSDHRLRKASRACGISRRAWRRSMKGKRRCRASGLIVEKSPFHSSSRQ